MIDATATEYIEGFGLVDSETGELIQAQGETPSTIAKLLSDGIKEFEMAEAEVEWALRKLVKIDSQLVANKARLDAELSAIKTNWEPEVNKLKRAKEGFLRWLKPSLDQYARRTLATMNANKKTPTKTVKFPFGSLSFRATQAKPATVVVKAGVSQAELIKWFEENWVQRVMKIVDLNFTAQEIDDLRKWLDATTHVTAVTPCPLEIVDGEPAGEEFYVRTGVK
jgi:hypothetical protein